MDDDQKGDTSRQLSMAAGGGAPTLLMKKIDYWAAAALIFMALLSPFILPRTDIDIELLLVVCANLLVMVFGSLCTLVFPNQFSITQAKMGGAFVVTMSVFVLLALPSIYAQERNANPEQAMIFAVAVMLSYLLVIFSLVVIELRSQQKPDFKTSIKSMSFMEPAYLPVLIIFSVVVTVSFAAYVWPIASVEAFRGVRSAELAALRQDSFSNVNPPIFRYIFGFVREIALPFSAATLAIQAVRRGGLKRYFYAVAILFAALFAATLNMEKALIPVVLTVIVLSVWLTGEEKAQRRVIAFGSFGVIASLLLSYKQAHASATQWSDVVGAMIRRIVVLPSDVVYSFFEWTSVNGFLKGQTIPYMSQSYNEGHVALATVVYDYSYATYPDQQGSAAAAYVGFLWADFGWFGIIFGSVLIGLALGGIEQLLRVVEHLSVGAALRAVAFSRVILMAHTTIFTSLLRFPFGFVDLLILVVGWQAASFMLKKNTTIKYLLK